MRAFCPKCGGFCYGYDPAAKVYRCYNRDRCGFIDKKGEYGEGLSDNPFIRRDPSGLEIIANSKDK